MRILSLFWEYGLIGIITAYFFPKMNSNKAETNEKGSATAKIYLRNAAPEKNMLRIMVLGILIIRYGPHSIAMIDRTKSVIIPMFNTFLVLVRGSIL